jgi:hypothetical protein
MERCVSINHKGRSVLLVGSVPLSSAEEVFEAISSELGKFVKRIPDGETGSRSLWIVCQSETMKGAQGLEVGGERQLQGGIRNPRYKIKEGQKPEDVKFGRLGYADNALESYKIFKRLQALGKIPSGVRFQVCLPTPLAVVYAFFIASEVRRIWPLYERRLLEELDEITRTISHNDLAIQLDIATEMHTLLEVPELQKEYPINELVDAFARLGNRVPPDVELGIHLCYGDPGHKHIREPTDMGRMIDVYHRLAIAIPRTITWLHMPVPRDRVDDTYFSPLRNLKLKSGTELYLGLIHLTDGIEGAKRRATAAKRFVSDFGVATECGFGRRPPETILDLIQLHRMVAQQV